MRVRQIVRAAPIVVSPEESVSQAAAALRAANVGAAVVVASGDLLGVICERSISRRVVAAGANPAQTRVGDAMSKPVRTIRIDDRVDEAIAQVVEHRARHLAVIDEHGALVGLLSARDVFEAQLGALDDAVKSLEAWAGEDDRGG